MSIAIGALLLFTIATLTGCATTDLTAMYRDNGGSYVVELTGSKRRMAHDPFTLVFGGTVPDNVLLFVPRVTGTVKASELRVDGGGRKFTGEVSFSGSMMTVDLYDVDTMSNKSESFWWNGHYLLKRRLQ